MPALLVCILPIGFLQWLLMLYAFGNSTFFLVLSLKKHIDGAAKPIIIFGVLGVMQFSFFLFCKLQFVHLGIDPASK